MITSTTKFVVVISILFASLSLFAEKNHHHKKMRGADFEVIIDTIAEHVDEAQATELRSLHQQIKTKRQELADLYEAGDIDHKAFDKKRKKIKLKYKKLHHKIHKILEDDAELKALVKQKKKEIKQLKKITKHIHKPENEALYQQVLALADSTQASELEKNKALLVELKKSKAQDASAETDASSDDASASDKQRHSKNYKDSARSLSACDKAIN